jgi:hypothetical protein
MATKKTTKKKPKPFSAAWGKAAEKGKRDRTKLVKSAKPVERKRPTDDEIDSQLADAIQWEESGKTEYFGMSYEQGVAECLRWIMGNSERPIQTLPEAENDDE